MDSGCGTAVIEGRAGLAVILYGILVIVVPTALSLSVNHFKLVIFV